jgi:quinoprotein glucose dehydrogenase
MRRPILNRSKYAAAAACLLFGLVVLRGQSVPKKQPYSTWSDYGGSADTMQYSSLKQIDKRNVSQLERVWFYAAPGPSGRFAFSPLVVDGAMYVVGKDSAILALDAATGKQIWDHPVDGKPTDRGFNYWQSKDGADRRLIFAADSYLQEINLRTGVTIPSFGKDGRVDLREGLGRDPKTIRNIQSGTPGRVFENLIILGSATGEGYGDPPGDLRAYDVFTGKQIWIFHTVPHPGEFGYDTWPKDAWKYIGGVNAWGEISIDEKRGIVYFPLGSPTYDLYGADRKGAGLYGDCLLALDARTGKRLWHFQLVYHDLWDYDPTTAPKLMTVRHDGKPVDIVAQATKFGFLYVFNRVTGEPLWPIEERPVPKSDVPGEESWPTQPFPTNPPPYARQKLTVDDVNPYVDEAEHARLREQISQAHNEGLFTPQTVGRETIETPGQLGGSNWGGTAADPQTGMLYVRTIDGPSSATLSERAATRIPDNATPEQRGFAVFNQQCATCHGAEPPKNVDAARVRAVVRKGQAEMPAFSIDALSDQNLEGIAAYFANPKAEALIRGSTTPVTTPVTTPAPPPGRDARYFGQFGNLMHASNGLPIIGPPWSELVAYDLNEGTIKWRVPLGVVSSLAAKGITNTGSYRPTRNGPVVTAGGLIFMATASDCMVHAYDKDTGKLLWEREVEANPDGIPAIYEVGGRQYAAFFAGVGRSYKGIAWKAGKPEGQGYYVFALPVARGHALRRRPEK